jgi:type II secretory pathway component PulJ
VSQRGFTVLEVAIASTLFVMTFGTALLAVCQDANAHKALSAHFGPELRARKAMEIMTSELRMAGIRGEDRDGDGILSDTEDINENFEFDANWNLADGAKDQPSLTFNRRIETRMSADEIAPSAVYSRGITYQLEGNHLVRIARRTDAKGDIKTRRTVLASGVIGLRFTRSGSVVTVALDVAVRRNTLRVDRSTLEMRVMLRN